MINKKIQEEIESLKSLHNIVETYEEIAAMRMRKVKKSVLQNREFLSGLNDIFQQVEHSYESQILLLKSKRRVKGKTTIPSVANNGKTVRVFVAANTGLYGDIIKRTFSVFMTDYTKDPSAIMVLGRLGKRLCDEAGLAGKYEYFDLPDVSVDDKAIKSIFATVVSYKNIIVYHGIFVDMLNQNPTKSLITRDILTTERSDSERRVECIFEPTLENIVSFFENQILGALFEQSIYESDLSKFASRMISLDLATVNIGNKLKQSYFTNKKVTHKKLNSKQVTLLSGISMWHS